MNKTILYSALSFVGGAAIGGLLTWKIVGKKIEKEQSARADAEIASVKEKFTVPKVEKKEEPKEESKEEQFIKKMANENMRKSNIFDYASKVSSYRNYSNVEAEAESKTYFKVDGKIEVIEPNEFGEDEDYDQVELTLYADGILADENDDIIDHVDDVVGPGNLDRMGEFEDDALHIKNEARKIYYEILVDNRSYKDATKKDPHRDDEED